MNFRLLVVSSLLISAAAAQASFEMMLMAGVNGIYRYDPQNNVSLGRFGMSGSYYYDVALDPTHPGEVVTVSGFGSVDRFDYSTGEFRGGFSLPSFYGNIKPQISVLGNGNIMVTDMPQSLSYGTTRIYSPTGTLLQSLQAFGSNYETYDSMETPDGTLHTLVRQLTGSTFSYYLFNYTSAGNYTGFIGLNAGATDSNQYANLGWVNNRMFISAGSFSPNPLTVLSSVSPFTAATAVQNMSFSGTSGATNWVGGHNGVGYMVQSYFASSQVNRLYNYNPNSNVTLMPNVTIPINDQLYGSAIVVAPEPASMVVLGIGLVGLLRRRRS